MRDVKEKSFLSWASHSLIGHIVLFQIGFGLPMVFMSWDLIYFGADLSLASVLRVLSLIVGAGLIVAVLFWYTISKPLISSRQPPNE
jgi:hypothetical protein